MASNFIGSCSSNSEEEMNKLGKENAHLRKTLGEVCGQKGAPSDSQHNHFFSERVLALETLREKISQQILARDQEITSLWQMLQSDMAEVVTSFHAQLNQQRALAEMRERLFQSLKQETEEVKNKLTVLSTKCQDLENTSNSGSADGHAAPGNSTLIKEQLKDALEKNHQWLVHDQQREAYVKKVQAEKYQLEQELHQAKKGLLQKEADSEEERDVETQRFYEKFVDEIEREQQKGQQLLTKHQQVRKELEKERLKSAELQQEVNILQKSLLNQHEDQSRMTVLEQQIQLSAKDLEDEKRDNQQLQWQLHRVLKELRNATDKIQLSAKDLEDEKRDNQHLQLQLRRVLKELRKATDNVAILDSEKAQRQTSSSVSNAHTELERVPKESPQSFSSPTRAPNLLEESFLECPNCRVQYPTSRHRELLVHIDQCFGLN